MNGKPLEISYLVIWVNEKESIWTQEEISDARKQLVGYYNSTSMYQLKSIMVK
jgi:hypothetical protein